MLKNRKNIRRGIVFFISIGLTFIIVSGSVKKVEATTNTPLNIHNQLSVKGTDIVDIYGNKFQLRGISTHGINWDVGAPFVNEAAFKTVRDEWGVNAVRLAMYTTEYNGYCTGSNQTALKNILNNGVQYATNLGMYAIIDWHVLSDQNPLTYKNQAKTFFAEMASKYASYNNVIYEICNEPNNCSWQDIKTYANEIIPIIRKYDKDAIIIVGTPTYSQLGAQGHTNEVADSPLTGYSNIMYALHFYAASSIHSQYLPDKLKYAIGKGVPVIVSEFGMSQESGDGNINTAMGKTWLDLMDENNVSYFAWSLSNKNESSALLVSSTNKTSGWIDSELSPAGKWIKYQYLARSKPKEKVYDFNNDNKVNIIDLAALSNLYNKSNRSMGFKIEYDYNDDNIIDIYDLVRLARKI